MTKAHQPIQDLTMTDGSTLNMGPKGL